MRAHKYPVTVRPCACLSDLDGVLDRQPWQHQQRFVRLWLDLSASGLWDLDGVSGWPYDLQISDALAEAVLRWQADYDDSWDIFISGRAPPEARDEYPHDHFDRRGDALAERLRQELGPDWAVVHVRLMRPADFQGPLNRRPS